MLCCLHRRRWESQTSPASRRSSILAFPRQPAKATAEAVAAFAVIHWRRPQAPGIFCASQFVRLQKILNTASRMGSPQTLRHTWRSCHRLDVRHARQSGRRGWLTPVLPHHRSCGSASGGSAAGTRQHVWSDTGTLSDSAIPSVTHLSSGRHPLSSNCFQHVRFLTCCITSNRRALSSVGFHRLLRYYGPD